MARRPPKNSRRAVGLAAPAFFQMSDACHRTCARCRIKAADASLSLCMVCMIRREVGPKMKIVCGFWDSERNFEGWAAREVCPRVPGKARWCAHSRLDRVGV